MFRMRRLILVWLAALVFTALLAGGCSDTGSMPVQPLLTTDAGPWETVYPPLATGSLRIAWGLDGDDMWAGGRNGTMLHWDGRQVRRLDFPTQADISEIQGLATDDVLALAGNDVYRWDGRRWTLAHDLDLAVDSFHLADNHDIYVGGDVFADTSMVAYVRRFDGHTWHDMDVPFLPHDLVWHIWRPTPDHPLLALTRYFVLRLDGEAWVVSDERTISLHDVDGDLALATQEFWGTSSQLIHFTETGRLERLCDDREFPHARAVVRSRFTVLAASDEFRLIHDCVSQHIAGGVPNGIYDLAIPERPGANGPAIFAVGRDALFLQGAWQPGGQFTWRRLTNSVTNDLDDDLEGNAEHLFAKGWHALIVSHGEQWSTEDIAFNISTLRALDEGRVLIAGQEDLVVREPDGTLTELATPPFNLHRPWCDGERGWAIFDSKQIWRLEHNAWTMADSLDSWIQWYDAPSADELYLMVDSHLLHYDGQDFDDLTPYPDLRIFDFHVGRITGRVYVTGLRHNPSRYYNAVYENGEWTEIQPPIVHALYMDAVCEIDQDLVIKADYNDLYYILNDEWVKFAELEIRSIEDIWGTPERGLYVLTSDSRILHHSLDGLLP